MGGEPADRLDAAARLGGAVLGLLAALAAGAVALSALAPPEPALAQRHLRWHGPGFAPPGAADPLLSHGGVPLGFRPGLDRLAPAERTLVGPAP